MPIAFNQLTEGRSTSDPSATASVTPTSGSAVYVAFAIQVAVGDPGDSVTVSGAGLTWTKVETVLFSTRRRLWVYRGDGTASSGAITIDYTGVGTFQNTQWSVDEATGADAGTPNDTAQIAAATTQTSIAVGDVGTPDAGDVVYGAIGQVTAQAITAEGTYTVLTNIIATAPTLLAMVDVNATPDETPSASWSVADSAGGIGFIVNIAAGGGGGGPAPTLPWLPRITNLQGDIGAIMVPSGFIPPNKV